MTTSENKKLQHRVLDISYKKLLSHLSSTLPATNILNFIYENKHVDDKVVLSNGHSGLALYCILEKFKGIDAEYLIDKHGIHPNRDILDGIDCSTGSLGMGLPIAVGMALGTSHNIHCVISDGEMAEGSIWEALRFINESKLKNIYVYVQANGYGAYMAIDHNLKNRALAFLPEIKWCYTNTSLDSEDPLLYHYKIMNKDEYQKLKKAINENYFKTTII